MESWPWFLGRPLRDFSHRLANIPSPARFAVHKLIVSAERRTAERSKVAKDLEQVAALAKWHLLNGQVRAFNSAWNDANKRGKGWRARAQQGRRALLARHPTLADSKLWR